MKKKSNTPIKFIIRIELGDGVTKPDDDVVNKNNTILKGVKEDLQFN